MIWICQWSDVIVVMVMSTFSTRKNMTKKIINWVCRQFDAGGLYPITYFVVCQESFDNAASNASWRFPIYNGLSD